MACKRCAIRIKLAAAIFVISAFVLFAFIIFIGCAPGTTAEPQYFMFEYSASDGGEILGNKKQQLVSGSGGSTVTAVANEGYEFVRWSDGSTGAARTDIGGDSDTLVTAYFTKILLTVTYAAGDGGKVHGAGTSLIPWGESASTVIASPDEGYYFDGWSDGVQGFVRTDTYIKADIDATAVFLPKEFSTQYTAGEGGGVYCDEGEPPQSAEYGSSVTVFAEPDDGYKFDGWSDGVMTYQRTDIVTGDIEVTALFSKLWFTVEYTHGYGGTLVGECVQSVYWDGSTTTVTAVPEDGYEFRNWSDLVMTATRTDDHVTQNISVNALFGVKRYTVTYNAEEGGEVYGYATQRVPIGTDAATVLAVAGEGYHFVGWSDGVDTAERTDTELYDDITVTARFEKNSYTLKYKASDGGSVTGDTEQTLLHGDKATTIKAVPDDGYYFDSWSDGLMSSERTDTATYDMTVTARFLSYYIFDLTADGKGYSVRARNPQRLINIKIPETYNDLPVTEIAESAFAYASMPLNVTIPKTVKKIGKRAFYYCIWLKSIDIPDNVEEIGESAFSNCKVLHTVTGMRGVKVIGDHAFWTCSDIEEITLPKGLTSLGKDIFRYTTVTVYTRLTVEQLNALNPEWSDTMEPDSKVVYIGDDDN